ncbi:MAG: DUF4255 domain-containing protein [Candidatus Zixiibacteriota bacterium]|nr:MAG: DUF4255 domain-containing protein [candidate division Zixibacteria bacterium]
MLVEHLGRQSHHSIAVGHPLTVTGENPKLALFLYEVSVDGSMRNVSLSEGTPAPLWLVLKYALTAFDAQDLSDSASAHEIIGQGMAALQEVNYLRLDSSLVADVRSPLENNPEVLKLTFEEATPELLSKLMPGPTGSYRFAAAFQVRPVMIVPDEPPSLTQLVGVDYSVSPAVEIGEDGIEVLVLPSLGPRISKISPDSFAANPDDSQAQHVEIIGADLHLSNLECLLGSLQLPIIAQRTDRLTVRIGSEVAAGSGISAGEHPVLVRQQLETGRYRTSNLLTARLRPTVTGVAVGAGTITVSGNLLGRDIDDIRVAFARNNAIVKVTDVTAPDPTDQTSLDAEWPDGLDSGTYRIFFVVNGIQAINSPTVVIP